MTPSLDDYPRRLYLLMTDAFLTGSVLQSSLVLAIIGAQKLRYIRRNQTIPCYAEYDAGLRDKFADCVRGGVHLVYRVIIVCSSPVIYG